MKTNGRFSQITLGVTLILLAVLGVYIANRTYHYETIVKGILGFVILYLLFFYIRYSKIDASLDMMLSDSRIHKYLIYAFIGPGIAFWAMGGIFDMIAFLVKTWSIF